MFVYISTRVFEILRETWKRLSCGCLLLFTHMEKHVYSILARDFKKEKEKPTSTFNFGEMVLI